MKLSTYTSHSKLKNCWLCLALDNKSERFNTISALLGAIASVLIVIALKPLLRVLPMAGFYYLFWGGLFYSVGVVFYALDNKVSYFHGIWHIFVLAGSFSHYIAVFYYVA